VRTRLFWHRWRWRRLTTRPARVCGARNQAACLRLLLLTPKALIDVPALITPLNMALRLGLSYPPLAVAALDGMYGPLASAAHRGESLRLSRTRHVVPAVSLRSLGVLDRPSRRRQRGRICRRLPVLVRLPDHHGRERVQVDRRPPRWLDCQAACRGLKKCLVCLSSATHRFRFDMRSEQRQLRSVGKLRRGRSGRAAAAAASTTDEVRGVWRRLEGTRRCAKLDSRQTTHMATLQTPDALNVHALRLRILRLLGRAGIAFAAVTRPWPDQSPTDSTARWSSGRCPNHLPTSRLQQARSGRQDPPGRGRQVWLGVGPARRARVQASASRRQGGHSAGYDAATVVGRFTSAVSQHFGDRLVALDMPA